jgi:signal transduction histidine kinase
VSRFADLLDRHMEEITQRFASEMKDTFAARGLSDDDVINTLREYMGEIADGLRAEEDRPGTEGNPPRSEGATSHGKQRFELGFDFAVVVREYGVLRDILFEIAERERVPLDFSELRVFSKHLIGGIADAATRYGRERDDALRRQTSKHLGFLAHELRNRLSTMRMAFGLLKSQHQLPKDSRPMAVLEKGFAQLQSLIDDALVEVKMGEKAMLTLSRVDLSELLASLARESALEADAKNIELRVEAESCVACADEKLLRSALSNLIGNAIKFTHENKAVFLRARAADHRVVIEVEDRCGGLPAERIHTIFDPFVQVGKDRSGFGLGLAIAKQAVDAHEGTLRVHSLDSKGCVFLLDLPQDGPSKGK